MINVYDTIFSIISYRINPFGEKRSMRIDFWQRFSVKQRYMKSIEAVSIRRLV